MKCTKCNHDYPDGYQFCPICGNKLSLSNISNHREYATKTTENAAHKQINTKYGKIQSFHEGLAVVCREEKYGFINLDGEEVVECKYYAAKNFSEGLAAVQKEYNGRWLFINHQGEEVISLPDEFSIGGYKDGFSDGLCAICCFDSENAELKYGYIDKQGNVAINAEFDMAFDFYNGLAFVSKNDSDGDSVGYYIDKTGSQAFAESYDGGGLDVDFKDGCAIVKPIGKNKRVINKNGECIFEFPTRVFWEHADSKYIFYGIKDNHGDYNKVVWLKQENLHQMRSYSSVVNIWGCFNENLMAVCSSKNKKWGFINEQWEETLPYIFDEAHNFKEHLAAVLQNGLWGYINTKGNLIIPYQYNKAEDFSEGRAVVEKDSIIMVVDNEGNRIV